MQSMEENAFLPTDNDKLRAQIKELKVRLALATEKRKKLKRQIIEEDISYLVVSKITDAIKDPTRLQTQQLEGLQKEIFEQLISTAEECTVHEIISYHRLGGRTIFNFSKHYQGLRLETFYNKVYREPYYLLFLNKEPGVLQKPKNVDKHTIPNFIPVDVLAARFLPHNMETFIRIVHDCVQAFVSRRELVNELEQLSPNVKVIYKNGSCTKVEFNLESFDDKLPVNVTLLFKNYASSFPTNITVKDVDSTQGVHDYTQMEQELIHDNIVDVFSRFLSNGSHNANETTEILQSMLDEDRLGEDEPMNTSQLDKDGDTSVNNVSMDMEID